MDIEGYFPNIYTGNLNKTPPFPPPWYIPPLDLGQKLFHFGRWLVVCPLAFLAWRHWQTVGGRRPCWNVTWATVALPSCTCWLNELNWYVKEKDGGGISIGNACWWPIVLHLAPWDLCSILNRYSFSQALNSFHFKVSSRKVVPSFPTPPFLPSSLSQSLSSKQCPLSASQPVPRGRCCTWIWQLCDLSP